MEFIAEVKHCLNGSGGIFAYFATMQDAVAWIGTWPEAVWAHIEKIGG
jgi:hypothetical protein